MIKTLSDRDSQRYFPDILNDVAQKDDFYIVESNGERVAAVVPVRMLEGWDRDR